jgi:hypothetical protein
MIPYDSDCTQHPSVKNLPKPTNSNEFGISENEYVPAVIFPVRPLTSVEMTLLGLLEVLRIAIREDDPVEIERANKAIDRVLAAWEGGVR